MMSQLRKWADKTTQLLATRTTVTVAQMILSCQNHKDTPKDRLTLEATNHRIVTVGHGSAEVYFNFHRGGS